MMAVVLMAPSILAATHVYLPTCNHDVSATCKCRLSKDTKIPGGNKFVPCKIQTCIKSNIDIHTGQQAED